MLFCVLGELIRLFEYDQYDNTHISHWLLFSWMKYKAHSWLFSSLLITTLIMLINSLIRQKNIVDMGSQHIKGSPIKHSGEKKL